MRTASVIGLALGLPLVLAAAGCAKTEEVADPLTGTTWQLVNIESMAPNEQPSTEIEQRSEYTVTFGDDGKAGFRVDCNRGSSTWKRDGEGSSGGLTFGPIALTRMTEDLLGGLADSLKPDHIAPVVAWLAHEDCDVSGEIYACGGGRVARIFIAETPGYFSKDLTLEDVRDNWDKIRDVDGYVIPGGIAEETGMFINALKNG